MYAEEKEKKKAVSNLIRLFGITPRYKGYVYVIEAVVMNMQLIESDHAPRITKDIYPQIGARYKVTTASIEKNIRQVVEMCWEADAETISLMAGFPLLRKPSNAQFLDILSCYLIDNG